MNTVEVKFTVPSTDHHMFWHGSAIGNINGFLALQSPLEKFDWLSQRAARAVDVKRKKMAFRDEVSLNQILRDPKHSLACDVTPRRGYEVITFAFSN